LVNFEISIREAIVLLVLFSTQVLTEFYVIRTFTEPAVTELSILVLYAYTAVYMVIGAGLFLKRRQSVSEIITRTFSTARTALGGSNGRPEHAD
jgi:cation:H+ antiporter